MTPEALLKQRYKVISDYPNTTFSIGDVIEFDGIVFGMNEPQKFVRNPEKYPSIFKKLEWWEDRDIKDMPEYAKHCVNNRVFRVKKWAEEYGKLIARELLKDGGINADWLYPATRQEYEQYRQSIK